MKSKITVKKKIGTNHLGLLLVRYSLLHHFTIKHI